VVQGREHNRVPDPTRGDVARDVLEGHQHDLDILSMIELGGMGQEGVLDEESVASVAHDGRIREHLADHPCMRSGVARFLPQFALTGNDRVGFVGVEHASGDLEFDGIGAMPVLFDHHELAVLGDRARIHPVDAVDDVEVVLLAGSGGDLDVGADREDPEVPDRSGAQARPRTNGGFRIHEGGRCTVVSVGEKAISGFCSA
jgi:hypothetical protein